MAKRSETEAPGMAVERVAVGELHADPANARRHPARNLGTIKASLARFGQQRPLLIDANNVVRAGNGTLMAAIELGLTHVDCVRTSLRGVEATAYAITDNRSAEQAEWDGGALAETLRALQSEPEFDMAAVGFTDDEINQLCNELTEGFIGEAVDDPESEWQGMPEFEHQDLTAAQSIHVHFKSLEDVRSFAELVGQSITEKTRSIWHPKQEIIRYGEAE